VDALVTGASRGIGRATAAALARAGARVALVARDPVALAAVAAELRAEHGVDAFPVPCDVTDGAAVEAACSEVAAVFGDAPDVVVNAAGVFSLAPAHETTADAFAAALASNLAAPFGIVRAFLGAMRARGAGHVVTVGSVADHSAFPENAAYAASKYGVRGLHEVLRAELRGSGVRATLVSPGPVDTALWDPIDPDARPGFTPRARMLRPDDVAAAILYAVTAPRGVNVDEIRLGPA